MSDKDGHTHLVMAVQIASAIERFLRNVIHDGEAAVEAIDVRGKRID